MSINEHTIHAALKELYKGTGMEITAADVQAGIEAMTAVRDKWLERNWEKVTRTVRIEGVEVVISAGQLADPEPNGPQECSAQEPYWPDGGGGAVCTLRAHPARSAHVAHDGEGVVAIWGGRAPAPAEPHDMVGECGVCGGPVYHSRGCKNAVEDGWVSAVQVGARDIAQEFAESVDVISELEETGIGAETDGVESGAGLASFVLRILDSGQRFRVSVTEMEPDGS